MHSEEKTGTGNDGGMAVRENDVQGTEREGGREREREREREVYFFLSFLMLMVCVSGLPVHAHHT